MLNFRNTIRMYINRLVFRLPYKSRDTEINYRMCRKIIRNFMIDLRDKCKIYFQDIIPLKIISEQHYLEPDDDRFYDMVKYKVKNIFTNRVFMIDTFYTTKI